MVRDILQWRHNERDSVSNHRRLDCLFNSIRSGADQRKHQSFTSLAFVRGIYRWHKGSVTREMFPFDDVIMNNAISNHSLNHELLCNEKSVLRWNTVVPESSQCKYMCSRAIAHWVFWSWRNWQSNYKMSLIPTQLSWRKLNNVTENSICNVSSRHLNIQSVFRMFTVWFGVYLSISFPHQRGSVNIRITAM